jgi:hypothetical protein
LGAGANPGGEGGAADFDDQDKCSFPDQSQELKTFDYDYRSNYPKKKKQSAEQCELDENVKDRKIEIINRIKENPALVREAERAGRDQDAQRSINNLVKQISLGNRNPAEAPKASPPTYELTKKALPENDQTTKPISPVAFTDWEGENKIIKSKELKKTLYAHGYKAGVVSSEDLRPCPIQYDPDKFQRTNCAPITYEGLDKLRDKIIDLATSTKPGMIKIELPMP